MNNARTAHKRPDEADHKIDRVVGGQDAQIAYTGPERIPRSQRLALLEIIGVGENTALGAASGPGGIDDAGSVFAAARNKDRIAFAAEFFPPKSATQVGGGGRFRDQNDL